MEIIKTYLRILSEATEVALATCVKHKPNVRIVSYVFDEREPGVLYFITEAISTKVAESLLNEHVAVTTIPKAGPVHIRSNEVVMKKSLQPLAKFRNDFITRIPACAAIFEAAGDELELYELRIKRACIVTGLNEPVKISFSHS